MAEEYFERITWLDPWVAGALLPVAAWVLLSGLDDLFITLVWLLGLRRERAPSPQPPATPKRIAVFIPCWKEDRVIRGMIEHNLAAIRYSTYDIFIGAYPNDPPTLDTVRDLESRFPRVHLALCPHNGPTSKADCLNWVYQRTLLYEEEHGVRYDSVVTHDAEDLIHPSALEQIAAYLDQYDFVQIPVLPLATPARELVHGVYCDEFADFQTRELPVRQRLGGFLPSAGVGTAVSRAALDQLAVKQNNRIFDPRCLTEDYEAGFRIHRLGGSQILLSLDPGEDQVVATREYFPRRFGNAVRQRTRWVMGIALQSWEMHGWRETASQLYWFWRDRKGLVGNLLTPFANLLFLYGAATWWLSRTAGRVWGLGEHTAWPESAFWATLGLQVVHLGSRMYTCGCIYGWRFALWVPLRTPFSNLINCLATAGALNRYLSAKLRGRPLVWIKTEHAYPSRAALMEHKRRLGDILIDSGYMLEGELGRALATRPPGVRLGEHLVSVGKLSEEELYEALSLQQNLALAEIQASDVPRRVARALPLEVVRRWRVLPFRVAGGQLDLISPELPTDEMQREVRRFTSLEVRFHLVTPTRFEELAAEFLRPAAEALARRRTNAVS